VTTFTILTLIFLVLKLTHYIDWSWWLVISPNILQIVLQFIAIVYAEVKGIPWKFK
jgi:hypothetical protein